MEKNSMIGAREDYDAREVARKRGADSKQQTLASIKVSTSEWNRREGKRRPVR